MSFPFGNWLGREKPLDTEGHRLIGLSDDGRPILAPKGHSLLLSAAGGGKTTRGAIPWILSLLSSVPKAAVLAMDAKSGEMASQLAPMLAKMGVKVAVIDDMNVRPELAEWRVELNPFGAVVDTFKRNPLDLSMIVETVTQALIEDPASGIDQNQHFRQVPRDIIEFALNILLDRNPKTAIPGGVSAAMNDAELLLMQAEIALEEGDEGLQAMAREFISTSKTENFEQHLSETFDLTAALRAAVLNSQEPIPKEEDAA